MIERVMLLKLQEAWSNDAGRAEVAALAREALAAIPALRAASVGIPADEASRKSWDLALTLRFDDLEGAAALHAPPAALLERIALYKAWSFAI
jgi:hypothetical protein